MRNQPTWTVQIANGMLGTTRYCGTFGSVDAAADYAREQASRARSFATFTVHTGTPPNPGRNCGISHTGTH